MAKSKVEDAHGGLLTEASKGGRRLTLDPIREIPIELTIREVESTIPAGFQQEWGTVNVDGDVLWLGTGAGLGSKYATIRFRGKGYVFEVNEIVEKFLDALGEETDVS
jgi:hypothetical protein